MSRSLTPKQRRSASETRSGPPPQGTLPGADPADSDGHDRYASWKDPLLRALFDTTILASGIVARTDPMTRVLDAAISGQVELALSPSIPEELRRTVKTKPYVLECVTPVARETCIARLQQAAIVVSPPGVVTGMVADPADDPIVGAAVSARVDSLVSGDTRVAAVGGLLHSRNNAIRASKTRTRVRPLRVRVDPELPVAHL